jgi:hypothetical protein
VKVSGRTDEATLAAINAWQGYRRQQFGARLETDGIFSVVPTTSAYYAPGAAYDIVHLNRCAPRRAGTPRPRPRDPPPASPRRS